MGVDRPSGTVTFVFTDIEGSSAMWEDDEAGMRVALERHDEILRRVVASRGGYVFTTAGDSFSAAFSRAEDALEAAVEVQRTLTAAFGPDGPVIRVRIGVHTGTADERDGDYFGPAVNRAARIMGAANGGQILASETTAGLVEDAAWHDHGEHRLAGLGHPVRLLEAPVDGLLAGRPLRTAGALRGNLRRRLNSFVGRDRELADLGERLAVERLVTLVGAGGTGKTSLAVETADRHAGSYPDGVWLIEFGLTRSGDALWEVAIETLGIPIGQDTTPRERLLDHLSTRHMLLVVDNCEHVRGDAATVVGDIVHACPRVTVLATSREVLHVVGEHVMTLDPLPSDGGAGPAVQLFYDRARDEGTRLPTAPETVDTITTICDQLDGIPLAIELAAARARSVPVDEIGLLLGERFLLLTGGRHGAAERHHTLRATVGWSYDLLDPTERAVFDRLSVFAGPFDVEAAAAVCDDDGMDRLMIVEALGSLVDKSMCVLRNDARHPYRLLETMRAYGLQNLAADDLVDEVSERHSSHYADRLAALTPGLYDGDETPVAEEMHSLVPEVRAAFAWAVDADNPQLARALIQPLWPINYRGWYAPTLWVAAARDRLPRQDWVIDWLTYEAFMRIDGEACVALHDEQQRRPPDGTSSRAPTLFYAGIAELFYLGGPSRAAGLLPALRTVSASATSPPDKVMPLFGATMIAIQLDTGGAELAEEVLRLGRACRWQTGEAFGLVARAMATDASQPDARFRACEEALEFAVRVGCSEVEGITLHQMLVPMLDQPAAIAAPHASRTLSLWADRGNWVNFRWTVDIVIALLAESGAHREALVALGYLENFSGTGTPAVQQRLDRAADAAKSAIADHQALLHEGASMTNPEIVDYLTGALADLEHRWN